jgi:hypothetical protein
MMQYENQTPVYTTDIVLSFKKYTMFRVLCDLVPFSGRRKGYIVWGVC